MRHHRNAYALALFLASCSAQLSGGVANDEPGAALDDGDDDIAGDGRADWLSSFAPAASDSTPTAQRLVVAEMPTAKPADVPPGTTALFVAPGASGDCSAAAPCDLPTAVAQVESLAPAMTSDINVTLHGGTYALTAPITLSSADSGQNGFNINYAAAPGEQRF